MSCSLVLQRNVFGKMKPRASSSFEQSIRHPNNEQANPAHLQKAPLYEAHIRWQFRSLWQDADGAMQLLMWHRNQKAVCHCIAAILTLADDSSMDVSS